MQRKPGRPYGSVVRQNIVEILFFYEQLHGYEIYKIYSALFPKITLRLVYYHLKKGVLLGELKVAKIDRKQGKYSWGGTSENIIYSLDKDARPLGEERVRAYKEK
jgi:hypothetical protein